MSKVRDSLEHASAAPTCSPTTRRIVQDGTAIDCLVAAIESGALSPGTFAHTLLEVYLEANERGDLKGETIRPVTVAQQWALEEMGFTRRGRRPRSLGEPNPERSPAEM